MRAREARAHRRLAVAAGSLREDRVDDEEEQHEEDQASEDRAAQGEQQEVHCPI